MLRSSGHAANESPDALPVYSLTHSIRVLIIKRCETTLSWEQLRSPQISQFLVKPIQNTIRSSHFTRATLYVLLANCLQFKREGQTSPAIVGICNTRALIAELLAMRLLKEYSTRELIDALSYDFDPMSGMPVPAISFEGVTSSRRAGLARTSTLEVGIRADAKKFVSHPVVVQHLEAIWAGSIVFHSAADHLHRYPTRPRMSQDRHYGAMHAPMDGGAAAVSNPPAPIPVHTPETIRRSVTLYDPSHSSLFKLSRLRVPRYREVFSTLSYIILLGLHLAVLSNHAFDLKTVEVMFWLWSSGFMLDELVGFSEQGFGLYIASVWNVVDILILGMLVVYYILRVTSLIMPGPDSKLLANLAYDVLAATAVPLWPRGFHLLDHFPYFSQLLIAFRLMFQDLLAVTVLITIACSGFFVAFIFSSGPEEFDASGVAFTVFQLLMGFTPAAWDNWADLNILGQFLMGTFLVIAHFVVVTILISVLTNSLMAVIKNASEEHQYLFAINVISMVKSDMLFSFIAPTNLAGWAIAPLRYCMPFRYYVVLNRTIIKLTHFPILFAIFLFERFHLLRVSFEPVDHIERRGRSRHRVPTFALGQGDPYGTHLRQPSAATFQDQALAEVFRRPYNDGTSRDKREPSVEERRKSVVDQWMSGMDDDPATPPPGDAASVGGTVSRRRRRAPRSVNSADLPSRPQHEWTFRSGDSRHLTSEARQSEQNDLVNMSIDDKPADADDELDDDVIDPSTVEEDESNEQALAGRTVTATIQFREPVEAKSLDSTVRARIVSSSPGNFLDSSPLQATRASRTGHSRQASTNTIVFKPLPGEDGSSTSSRRSSKGQPKRRFSRPTTAVKSSDHFSAQHGSSFSSAPRREARPIMPPSQNGWNKSVPNLASFLQPSGSNQQRKVYSNQGPRAPRRAPSFDAMALDLASDIGDNRHNEHVMSGSFGTQLHDGLTAMRRGSRREDSDTGAMSRMVLARMNTIEEGFKDILKEVKDLKNTQSRTGSANESGFGSPSKRSRPKVQQKRSGVDRGHAAGQAAYTSQPQSATQARQDEGAPVVAQE